MSQSSADELLAKLEMFGVRLGLEASWRLLAELGNPHQESPCVLIAGTNGKGSTAALLASMASAAGYRTGLYTSPHLENVTERIRIDGGAIDPEHLAELLAQVIDRARSAYGETPTYFEAMTAAAFLHFAAREVDLAVLEVGLGGRLDATNVCQPVLSIITRIALDHCQHLGDDLPSIAREKAGILRADRPALAWGEPPEAARTLEREARRVGARLTFADREMQWRVAENAERLQRLELQTSEGRHRLQLPLEGRHQVANLVLAVRAAEILRGEGWGALDSTAIAFGAQRCRWPGRLERVEIEPERSVLLDAAHNPDSTRALLDHLDTNGEPFVLLFGAMADKAVEEMLPALARRARSIVLTRPRNPRSAAPEALHPLTAGAATRSREDPIRALDLALEVQAREPDSPLLVVCGSIYLLGDVRRELRRRYGVPEAAAESIAAREV